MSKRTDSKPSGGKSDERSKLDRRNFFMLGGSVAAAAALPIAAEAKPESDAEKKKARYQETDHVKTFYRVNRY
jgi:hypothetical protein